MVGYRMDINEIKTKKQELSENIKKLIDNFEEETKCTINDIELYTIRSMQNSVLLEIKIDVRL